jgi:hypothetical protein
MNFIVAASVLAFLVIGSALAFVLRKILRQNVVLQPTSSWIDELSVELYRPMMRLLDNGDFDFIRSGLGFTARDLSQLRRDRCRIFREYLRLLHSDFHRVCFAIKLLMVQSQEDRPDLAAFLLRSQLAFAVGMARVQWRLLMFRFGLGNVDVASLLKLFDVARVELKSLVPSQLGANS